MRYLKDMETLLLQVAKPPGNPSAAIFIVTLILTRVLREVWQENTLRLKQMRKVFR